jgi:hypothetical protein
LNKNLTSSDGLAFGFPESLAQRLSIAKIDITFGYKFIPRNLWFGLVSWAISSLRWSHRAENMKQSFTVWVALIKAGIN